MVTAVIWIVAALVWSWSAVATWGEVTPVQAQAAMVLLPIVCVWVAILTAAFDARKS